MPTDYVAIRPSSAASPGHIGITRRSAYCDLCRRRHNSHLLADVLTPEGIQPFWPFSARRFSLRMIRRTGDGRETLLVLATALITLAISWGYA